MGRAVRHDVVQHCGPTVGLCRVALYLGVLGDLEGEHGNVKQCADDNQYDQHSVCHVFSFRLRTATYAVTSAANPLRAVTERPKAVVKSMLTSVQVNAIAA